MIKPDRLLTCTPVSLKNSEMSRILSAAVVSSQFRSRLLADPAAAVAGGYSGESFSLAAQEQKKLGAIHAGSLADFAAQLCAL